MRTSIIATAVALGAILAACGGGGSGTTPSAAVDSQPPINPSTQVNNSFNGPTSQLSVTVAIPHRTESATAVAAARTRVQAIHGKKISDASIRTMANTAGSSQLRAVGQKLNAWASAYEKSNGRSPAYVSPATYYLELDVYSGSTMVQDYYTTCSVSASTCTGTFTVPVGTGYTVSMYLYDSCDYLLAAGVANNVAVVAGSNNPLTITLDGVVAYLDITSSPSQITAGDSQSVAISVTPLDAEYYVSAQQLNTITTPGTLINESLVPITAVTLSLGSTYTDVSPSTPQTLPLPSPAQSPATAFGFGPATYTYAGTGNESSVEWTVAEVANGSPIISSTPSGPYGYGYSTPPNQTGTLLVQLSPEALFLIATPGSPAPTIQGFPAYVVSTSVASSQTTTTVEFGLPTPGPIQVALSVNTNFNDAGATLTLSTNNCHTSGYDLNNGISQAFPVPEATYPPVVAATMPPSGNYNFTFDANLDNGSGACNFTVTDSNNLSAAATLDFDSTTLTVSGKARSK